MCVLCVHGLSIDFYQRKFWIIFWKFSEPTDVPYGTSTSYCWPILLWQLSDSFCGIYTLPSIGTNIFRMPIVCYLTHIPVIFSFAQYESPYLPSSILIILLSGLAGIGSWYIMSILQTCHAAALFINSSRLVLTKYMLVISVTSVVQTDPQTVV